MSRIWLVLDARLRTPEPAAITIVAIDEKSIDVFGAWPWPRATWAELISHLDAFHTPTLTVIDAVFPPSPEQQVGNRSFAHSLASSAAVVGQLLLPEPGSRGRPAWTRVTASTQSDFEPVPDLPGGRFAGVLGSEEILANAAAVGHINAEIDTDGIMRHVPSLLCLNDRTRCAESLVQAMISQLLGTGEWHITRGTWLQSEWMLQPGSFRELALPVDERFNLSIPWRHPSGIRYVSAADIWQGGIPPGALDRHIVLFGGVSLGLGDAATSPLYVTVPGVEVHAQTFAAWLRSELPYQPRYAVPMLSLWALLMAALLVANAQSLLRLRLITATGTLAPVAGAAVVWLHGAIIWPIATPVAFLALGGIMIIIGQHLRERTYVLERVEQYLPTPLRRLLNLPQASVPTEKGWGTVLVADIVGYTAQSQRLSLENLAQWCDTGINHVVACAQENGAMLDNVAGDGVLLLWRHAPADVQARLAIQTAIQVLEQMDTLNANLAAQELPPLAMGLGIHAGDYLLGSFGSEQKRYTVISDVANLAAHIERKTRGLPWPVLCSETLARALPAEQTRQVTSLPLINSQQMALYTLADCDFNRWPDGVFTAARPARASEQDMPPYSAPPVAPDAPRAQNNG